MNAMGHEVKTLIGARESDLRKSITKAVPDYMAMGSKGMAEMGRMRMPLPDNTLPMMTGFGQFGPLEMGGMFSVVKVREGLAAGDYSDPGPYPNPEGTVAYEYKGPVEEPARRSELPAARGKNVEFTVIKPSSKPMSKSAH
jgi:hypothetical protein